MAVFLSIGAVCEALERRHARVRTAPFTAKLHAEQKLARKTSDIFAKSPKPDFSCKVYFFF